MKSTTLLSFPLPATAYSQTSTNNSALFGYAAGGIYPSSDYPYSFSTEGQTVNATGSSIIPGYNSTLPARNFNTTYANYTLSINVTELWAGGQSDHNPTYLGCFHQYLHHSYPAAECWIWLQRHCWEVKHLRRCSGKLDDECDKIWSK